MHESGGSWFYHHAECCELRCRCILHSRRRSYPRSCLPPLVVPVHSRSNRLVALSRSGCPTHAMTAPFPIEQPHSPLFDPRGLPHTEAARVESRERTHGPASSSIPPGFFLHLHRASSPRRLGPQACARRVHAGGLERPERRHGPLPDLKKRSTPSL